MSNSKTFENIRRVANKSPKMHNFPQKNLTVMEVNEIPETNIKELITKMFNELKEVLQIKRADTGDKTSF